MPYLGNMLFSSSRLGLIPDVRIDQVTRYIERATQDSHMQCSSSHSVAFPFIDVFSLLTPRYSVLKLADSNPSQAYQPLKRHIATVRARGDLFFFPALDDFNQIVFGGTTSHVIDAWIDASHLMVTYKYCFCSAQSFACCRRSASYLPLGLIFLFEREFL